MVGLEFCPICGHRIGVSSVSSTTVLYYNYTTCVTSSSTYGSTIPGYCPTDATPRVLVTPLVERSTMKKKISYRKRSDDDPDKIEEKIVDEGIDYEDVQW